MKKLSIFIAVFALFLAAAPALAKKPYNSPGRSKQECTTIQDGLFASNGDPIVLGFDEFGYNYQAHEYIGYYGNYQRPPELVDWGYRLMMKWNDAWLSNSDCDGDGLLDRHFGYDSYIGSGAWLTNHQSGEYIGEGEEECNFTYFVKIVAAPADAYVDNGYWYTADGVEIGEVIWGSFAVVKEVENDSCAGLHGNQYNSPASPGFGFYKP